VTIDQNELTSADQLVFYVNGKRHCIDKPDPDLLLVDYLRSREVGLTGTKHSCGQGGCGSCAVTLSTYTSEGEVEHHAINSCLRPVCSLHGAAITTVEGLGSVARTVSPEQHNIAAFNGSQCGYCTPGFVMTMHSLRKQYPSRTKAQIEQAFDGNICRCTGFRPILYAMKHFASDWTAADAKDTPPCVIDPAFDIEVEEANIDFPRQCPASSEPACFSHENRQWFLPQSIGQLEGLREHHRDSTMRLVNGNTSVGIPDLRRHDAPITIDISRVLELKGVSINGSTLSIGAGVTYTELIDVLESTLLTQASDYEKRALEAIHYMARRTAGAIVRNAATVGGNTMLVALNAREGGTPFPSDLVTVLCGLDAEVEFSVHRNTETLPLEDFLNRSAAEPGFAESVLLHRYTVVLTREHEYTFVSKVALREVNSHSLVNMAVKLRFDADRLLEARIVIGALAPLPLRPLRTEKFLCEHEWSADTVTSALSTLRLEIDDFGAALPQWYLGLPYNGISREYQSSCAVELLHKQLIKMGLIGDHKIFGDEQRVEEFFERVTSRGTQSYVAPKPGRSVGEPVIKLSAFEQATGEAEYVHDMVPTFGGAYGAFVLSARANACFQYCLPDAQDSVERATLIQHLLDLYADQFVDLVDSADIPKGGIPGNGTPDKALDPWFAHEQVSCIGQSIALVVATDKLVAESIAAYVSEECIVYNSLAGAIYTIEEAVAKKQFFPGYERDDNSTIESPAFADNSAWTERAGPITYDDLPCLIVEGRQYTGAQNQFYMEPQSCLAEPVEGRKLLLHPSSQDPKGVHQAVADTLGLPANRIDVVVKRLGGGYGGKTTRSPYVAVPAALAAWKLDRPVLVAMPRNQDSAMIGNRHPFRGDYKALVVKEGPEKGRILGLATQFYANGGNTLDCSFGVLDCAQLQADGPYYTPYFHVSGEVCRTNIVSSGAMRSFGVIQGCLIQEDAVEACANAIGMRVDKLRKKNFYKLGQKTPYGQALNYFTLPAVWKRLKRLSEFKHRRKEIEKFNSENTWCKRGISLIPMKYGLGYNLAMIMQGSALIDVFVDGTVTVHHTGVEMGQGVHTKAVQVAADALNIPLEMIAAAALDTNVLPNPTVSGGTSTSELSCGAVLAAGKKLRRRLECFCNELREENGHEWCIEKGINFWDFTEGWRTEKEGVLLWHNIVNLAYTNRVNLASQENFATPGLYNSTDQQFYGFTYSAACTEVEIDVLTGESRVLRSDIVYDIGDSLNPAIDIGQIEGGFVLGLGNVTTEYMVFQPDGDAAGKLNTPNTWDYKPPAVSTIPREFNIDLFPRDDEPDVPRNPNLLLSSKGVGEPPTVLASSAYFAIKAAILAARESAGLGSSWFRLDSPATVERIQQACRNQQAVRE